MDKKTIVDGSVIIGNFVELVSKTVFTEGKFSKRLVLQFEDSYGNSYVETRDYDHENGTYFVRRGRETMWKSDPTFCNPGTGLRHGVELPKTTSIWSSYSELYSEQLSEQIAEQEEKDRAVAAQIKCRHDGFEKIKW